MSDDDVEPVNAPLAELRVASALRSYERFKLVLLVSVLMVNLAIGTYLVGIARNTNRIARGNTETLVILRCAVARSTSIDEHGKLRTPEASRIAFEKCVQDQS